MYKAKWTSHNWLAHRQLNQAIMVHVQHLRGVVVDLGCGTKPFAGEIGAVSDFYIGLDWSNSLHACQADVIADVSRVVPLADHSVDGVVSFEVLEHLPETMTFLHEAHRILKPGGVLLLSVPFQWRVHEEPWDFYRFTAYGLDHVLHRAGFAEVEIVPRSGFWSTWILKLNYQLRRLIRGPQLLRPVIRLALVPIWFLLQWLAIGLDKIWREEKEASGYIGKARKPAHDGRTPESASR